MFHLPVLDWQLEIRTPEICAHVCQLVCRNVRFEATADLKEKKDLHANSKYTDVGRGPGDAANIAPKDLPGGADNIKRAGELAVQTMNQLWIGILQPNRGPKMISG